MEKVFKTKLASSYYDEYANPNGFLFAPVDIIIPFHNEHHKVSRLLQGIFGSIRTNRYQISLVDDGSTNEEFIDLFRKVPGVVSFRHEEQRGFGAALNTAIQRTKQPYILILHSDVEVRGGSWLSELGKTYNDLREKKVKMIGAMTNNPVVDDERMICESGNTVSDFILGDGFLPLYCALCKRELFNRVGLFKEYPYAGGEAEEFAFRMRKKGYKQGVCGSSWVYHEGRGTLKNYDKDTGPNKRVQEVLEKAKQELKVDVS